MLSFCDNINTYFYLLVYTGQYHIPKGSVILSSMDYMHRSSKNFKDPLDFVPGRFMHDTRPMASSANGKIEDRDQYNFGWGRRICPGIYLVKD
jgi:cytochrome P450